MPLPISNAEHIYRNMRRSIINGELPPGERLLIRAICEQFGTSSSPVIEAIRRLEQEGLVVSRQNAGAQVQEWSAQDVVRSYLTREAVDGMAARLFVKFATDDQRMKLSELNEGYHQAARSKNLALVLEADTAYHTHIIQCTLPLPMQKAMESIYAITMTFYCNNPLTPISFDENVHDDMTDALVGDDTERAYCSVQEDVEAKLRRLVELGIANQKDIPAFVRSGGVLMEASSV